MLFISRWFRFINSLFLKKQGLIGMILKCNYLISVMFYMRWTKTSRPNSSTWINSFDGNLKINIDLSKRMGACIFWTGYHEFNECRFLQSYLKPEMVFVDVGANQGEFSLFAAKRLLNGRVYSFEPLTEYFHKLVENVQANGLHRKVSLVKLGVSDTSGRFPIYFDSENKNHNEGIASLHAQAGTELLEKEIIETTTLDSYFDQNPISRLDVLKIDVEGSEFQVLKGAMKTLVQFKPLILIELSEANFNVAGYTIQDVVAWLGRLRYEMYHVKKGRLIKDDQYRTYFNAVFKASE